MKTKKTTFKDLCKKCGDSLLGLSKPKTIKECDCLDKKGKKKKKTDKK